MMNPISIGILIGVMLVFGCATRQDTAARLTEAELNVLENYHESPETLEQAARICLKHRLTKSEVVRFMGKAMRTEVEDKTVKYFWMPSQILTFSFDEREVIVNADMGFKQVTRDDTE